MIWHVWCDRCHCDGVLYSWCATCARCSGVWTVMSRMINGTVYHPEVTV